jgi:hypothetical protein
VVKYLLFIVLLFGLSPSAFGQEVAIDNPEMAMIFEADQDIRSRFSSEKASDQEFVSRMIAEDEARRTRTAQLINDDALSTANDFYRAAFIYQHGGETSSYLVAHTLAVAAAARGHQKAGWISAATLDRYLQSIGQPQIYGTQTSIPSGGEPTKEPYDRNLIPDSLRTLLGVPSLAVQEERSRAVTETKE